MGCENFMKKLETIQISDDKEKEIFDVAENTGWKLRFHNIREGETNMVAPKIQLYISRFRRNDGGINVDENTEKLVDKLFDIMKEVEPFGDDERRSLWLKADRGTIEEYGDFEEMKEAEMVNTYEEFEEMWLDEFPDETMWYEVFICQSDSYRAVFLNNSMFYESEHFGDRGYPYDFSDLFTWIIKATQKAIVELKEGIYNDNVEKYLNVDNRTGTIPRKDYWEIFPESKESYFEDISQEEVEEFVSLIEEQLRVEAEKYHSYPVGNKVAEMTASDFFGYCALGYKANNYEMADKLSARELYYKYADGRDEGLRDIEEQSPEAFHEWYHDRNRGGGHPWEVCAGGNSTHVSLLVRDSDDGYYLELAGKSWGRSVETIKFYIALRKAGVAVHLWDAKELRARLLGEDLIGIVPKRVFPRYCESMFPEASVVDFMHLPYEKKAEVVAKTTWHKESERFLINISM